MSAIDDRVVRMEFDNKQFESGVSETMGSLQKLKAALNLRGSEKGMADVQKAADSLNFDSVNAHIYEVQQNFSFFGQFVKNIFDRISNKVIDLGSTMVRSLTTEPLSAGFSEYQLQMDSVQTIMASTGKSIDVVSGYLDELNTYADKTIYSFSDMTANIGKFTNAGVELDDAVAAIQGISNEAALSGANAAEASRAMYNFSQALSAGAVKLVDWKSIENANMATKGFKEQLIETAVALGTVKKTEDGYVSTTKDLQGKVSDAFTSTKGFNESLSAQWMTTEVLTETLKQYSTDVREMSKTEKKAYEDRLKNLGFNEKQIKKIEELGKKAFDSAQDVKTFSQLVDTVKESLGSGWTKSFQYMIGDLEEAKVLWTGVNKEINAVLDPIAKAREEMLKFWHDHGGRKAAIKAVSNAWTGVKNVMGLVSTAYKNVFPPITGKRLVEITKYVRDLTKRFKEFTENTAAINTVRNIFGGFFALIKMGMGAVQALYQTFKPVIDALVAFAGGIATALGYFGSFLQLLSGASDRLKYLSDSLKGVGLGGDVLGLAARTAVSALESLIKSLLKFVGIDIKSNPLTSLYDRISQFASEHLNFVSLESLGSIAQTVMGALSNLGGVVSTVLNGALSALGAILNVLLVPLGAAAGAFDAVGKSVGEAVGSLNALDVIKGVLAGISSAISLAGKKITEIAGKVGEVLPQMFKFLGSTELKNVISNFNQLMKGELIYSVQEFVDSARDNLDGMKDVKASFSIFGAIEDKIAGAVESLTDVFDALKGTLSAFTNSVNAAALLQVGIAIAVVAGSLALLAGINPEQLANGLAGIGAAMGILVAAFKQMDNSSGVAGAVGTSKMATSLIKMAVAVGILGLAVKAFSEIGLEDLIRGILGVAAVMSIMTIAAISLSKFGGDLGKSVKGMISFAIAIRILALSVQAMSSMSFEELRRGLLGVAGLLAEIAVFSRFFNGDSLTVRSAISILILSAALKTLGSVAKRFSKMDYKQIGRGLLGIAGLLGEIAIFSRVFSGDSLTVGIAIKILLLVAAIKVLETVATKFSSMSMGELVRGIGGVAALLGSIVAFTRLLSKDTLSLTDLVGIFSAIEAVKALEDAVMKFSALTPEQALVGFGGVIAIFVGLGKMTEIVKKNPMKYQDAAGLLALSNTIAKFAAAVATLGQLSVKQIIKGVLGLGAVVYILTSSIQNMSKQAKESVAGTAAFFILTKAIESFIPVFQTLGSMPFPAIIAGIVGLVGAFGALAIGALIVSKMSKHMLRAAGSILAFAASCSVSLAMFGASLVIAAAGITAFAVALATGSAAIDLKGLGGFAASLGIMIIALKLMGDTSPQMLAGAAALVVVSAALHMFIPVLQTLGSMSLEGIIAGVLGLAGALVILGVGSVVISGLSAPMYAAAIAVAMFGAACVVAGAGMLLSAAGVMALGVAFRTSAGDVIEGAGKMAVGIAAALVRFVTTLLKGIEPILEALGVALHAIGNFITQNIPYIMSVVGTLLLSLIELAASYIPQAVTTVGMFVTSLLTALVGFIPTIANALVTGAITLINALANGIRDNAEPILAAVRNILSSIIELVLTALADIFRMIPGVGDFLAGEIEKGKETVQKTLAPETLETSTKGAMDGATKGIKDGGTEMANAAAEVGDEAKARVEESLSGGEEISGSFMTDMLTGFVGANGELALAGDENLASYLTAFTDTGEAGQAGTDVYNELLTSLGADPSAFGLAGTADMDAYLAAFDPTAASKGGGEIASSAATGAEKKSPAFNSAAKTDGRAFVNSLSGVSAGNAGKTMASSGSAGAGSMYGAYQSTGTNLTGGFSWGMMSPYALSLARAAGVKVGQTGLNAVKDTIRSKSPSREAMKIGKFFTQGYAIGIGALSNVVYDEASNVGFKSLDGIRNTLQAMSKYIDADIDVDPTIRPVLDLTDIQNGIGQMNGMFNRADEALTVGFGNGAYANSLLNSVLNTSSRFGSSPMSDALNASAKTVNVTVNLQYDASADANDLARGFARAVQPYVVRGE